MLTRLRTADTPQPTLTDGSSLLDQGLRVTDGTLVADFVAENQGARSVRAFAGSAARKHLPTCNIRQRFAGAAEQQPWENVNSLRRPKTTSGEYICGCDDLYLLMKRQAL